MAKGPVRRVLKRLRNDLLAGAFFAFVGVLRILPLRAAKACCAGLGYLVYYLLRRERGWGLQNLEDALGDRLTPGDRRRVLRRAFANLGRNVAEIVHMDRMLSRHEDGRSEHITHITPAAQEIFTNLRKDGLGYIFVSGHIGNWELAGPSLVKQGLGEGYAIAKPFFEPRIDAWIKARREMDGLVCLQRGDPNMGMVIARGFRKRKSAAFLIDQDTKVPGVFVPFFGREAWTPSGPALFAAKFKIPVVVTAMHRRPDGDHELSILGSLAPPENSEEGILAATAEYTRLLEDHIREHPEEWIWFHRRWKSTPESRYVVEYRQSRERGAPAPS